MSWTRVVAITGCDSGLGWALAARLAREGLVTVAGMYNGTESEASYALKSLCAHPHKLDVTDPESIAKFYGYVKHLLERNPEYKLYALVNNAGVMTIADYEIQTPHIIENTINVNLLGSMRMASAFLPDLRRTATEGFVKPRIINIASHCGLQPLPRFGPYSASKAGLLAWTRSLRLEHSGSGLTVAAFVPGGFVGASNLMFTQKCQEDAILKNMTEEQKPIYESKIITLNNYLCQNTQKSRFDALKDENIIETFMKVVHADKPKLLYKVETWRYKFYYALMKIPFPEPLHLWIIKKFLIFPN
ncbi:D-beta-hydroxybutyrate dehydrogenase, mitochondrial [Colias croceus]|uniref:D-beta-hydroxybutyrate dehydrogenase, mitochondrial n=1 Tax=Colias crocea TaxID=72248 RepID=UPI001E27E69A|nr:D-beta-hydroxybutyrate dehydrogenase, mitochondrial [Colias croceus]